MSTSSTSSFTLSPTPTSAISDLRSTLSQTYRISITDGRIFLGTFACIDKEKNIVLINADEWWFEEGRWCERYVGMIMVPWEVLGRVECMLGSGSGSGEEGLYT